MQRIIPLRGPQSVLWIVVVVTSACGTGFGCSPAATSPAKWAMSTISLAPTSSAISRKAAKSSWRGYADQPATITFGRCSCASRSTSSMSHEQVLAPHVVGDDVVELAGDVQLHPVREMAAVVERHPHDRVAGLEHRHVGGVVGLGACVRLHVRVLGAEQLLGAVDRQLLGDVHLLAAAVVAAPGIALGVLVRQDRAGGLEHRLGDEVLRGDHLERVLLAVELALQHLGDRRIHLGEPGGLEVVGERAHIRHSKGTG